ncbi:transposase [Streptomyces sp. NPDC001750]|uniref:transposase n=1 Tax=Streptomyces sp. NPDC001750 TaxID=3364607 RepID=UPI003689C399
MPLAIADAGYGDAAAFRHGLQARGLNYVVGIASTLSARRRGAGDRAVLRDRTPAGGEVPGQAQAGERAGGRGLPQGGQARAMAKGFPARHGPLRRETDVLPVRGPADPACRT